MYVKLLLTALCVAHGAAYASNLSPGGSVSPVPPYSYGAPAFPSGFPNSGLGQYGANPFLQEGASWAPGASQTPGANITFENAVYSAAGTGDLDFFYQIQNSYTGPATGSDTVSPAVILDDFSLPGVTITGVEQITAPLFQPFDDFVKPTPATNSILSVSLGIDDRTLTVNFSAPINPGQDSAILVIETNAKSFNQNAEATFQWLGAPPAGAHGIADTQIFALDALEPVATPEPNVYGVLSLAVAGLLFMARRDSVSSQKQELLTAPVPGEAPRHS
jgi:hypothetical protein